MYFDYTPEQKALRDELRAYFDHLITDELLAELDEAEGGGPLYHEAMQRLGADGWLGIGWPKEHGGQAAARSSSSSSSTRCSARVFPFPS